MKDHLFHIIILGLAVLLASLSIFYKDSTEAMVALVDSQVTAVSFRRPVIVDKIHVVPGQEVNAGEILIEVARPDLDLDFEKLQTEMERLQIEREALISQMGSKTQQAAVTYQGKREQILSEINEVQLEIQQYNNLVSRLNEIENRQNAQTDSISQIKLKAKQDALLNLQKVYQEDREFSKMQLHKEIALLDKKLLLTNKELESLQMETTELKRYASFGGTIGSVNVQLGELIPPYKTLITLYESRPSLIKAFVNERISYQVSPDDAVWVESENRLYRVPGEVIEIGSRITSFPDKIDPNPNFTSYGQEVFVKISPDNRFLNGEKVFVYPAEKP